MGEGEERGTVRLGQSGVGAARESEEVGVTQAGVSGSRGAGKKGEGSGHWRRSFQNAGHTVGTHTGGRARRLGGGGPARAHSGWKQDSRRKQGMDQVGTQQCRRARGTSQQVFSFFGLAENGIEGKRVVLFACFAVRMCREISGRQVLGGREQRERSGANKLPSAGAERPRV